MTERTITVTKWTGKEVTLNESEYTQRWIDELGQISLLAKNESDFRKVDQIRETVAELAKEKFAETYELQNEEA